MKFYMKHMGFRNIMLIYVYLTFPSAPTIRGLGEARGAIDGPGTEPLVGDEVRVRSTLGGPWDS